MVGGGWPGWAEGWVVYEACEVKKTGKITLSFNSPDKEKDFFNIYDVITSPEQENAPHITSDA